jgi:O-antigen/teichoic acid export membrane protein
MVLIFFLTSLLGVFQSIINGLQEMAITNAAAVLQSACMVALNVALLRAGFGLYGVILATVLSLLIAVGFLLVFVIRLIPGLRLASFLGEPRFIPVLRFGATVQLARISSVAVGYADRILIGHFLGLVALAKYQLAYTVATAIRGLVLLLPSAVIPVASDLAARNERSAIRTLYWRGSKYILLVTLAISSAIITLAPEITHVWLGHDDPLIAMIIRFLTAGHAVHVLTGLGTSMCEGLGMVGLEVKFGFGLTVLQATLGIVAVRYFGLLGLLCSTTTVMAVTSVLFLYKFDKQMVSEQHVSWSNLLATPLAASALASCLVLLLARASPTVNLGIIAPAAVLALQLGLFLSSYALFLLRSSYLDEFDRQLAFRLPGGPFWSLLLSRGQRR